VKDSVQLNPSLDLLCQHRIPVSLTPLEATKAQPYLTDGEGPGGFEARPFAQRMEIAIGARGLHDGGQPLLGQDQISGGADELDWQPVAREVDRR
jgi:hypothetical protein